MGVRWGVPPPTVGVDHCVVVGGGVASCGGVRGGVPPAADGVQSRGVSTTTRSGDRGAGESDCGAVRMSEEPRRESPERCAGGSKCDGDESGDAARRQEPSGDCEMGDCEMVGDSG